MGYNILVGFPHSSVGRESACNAGDLVLIPGLERFPGEGNGNPLQYSCLENPKDRGAWWAAVYGVKQSWLSSSSNSESWWKAENLLCISKFPGEVQSQSVQLLSHARLCNPMDCSTPGFPVHHQLPELACSNSCPSSR